MSVVSNSSTKDTWALREAWAHHKLEGRHCSPAELHEVLNNCGVGFNEADSLKILKKADLNAMEIKFTFQDFLAYYLRLPKTAVARQMSKDTLQNVSDRDMPASPRVRPAVEVDTNSAEFQQRPDWQKRLLIKRVSVNKGPGGSPIDENGKPKSDLKPIEEKAAEETKDEKRPADAKPEEKAEEKKPETNPEGKKPEENADEAKTDGKKAEKKDDLQERRMRSLQKSKDEDRHKIKSKAQEKIDAAKKSGPKRVTVKKDDAARLKAASEEKRKAEEEAKKKADEEAKKKADEEEAEKKTNGEGSKSGSESSSESSTVSSEGSLAGASSSSEEDDEESSASDKEAEKEAAKKRKARAAGMSDDDANKAAVTAQEKLEKVETALEKARKELYHVRRETAKRKEALKNLTKKLRDAGADDEDAVEELDEGDAALLKGGHVSKNVKRHAQDVIEAQAVARRFLSRRRIRFFDSQFVRDYVGSKEAKEGRMRNNVLHEILSTERVYVTALEKVREHFLGPLRLLNMMPESDIDSVFGDLEIIVDLNNIILSKLEDRLNQWPRVQLFGDIFKDSAPLMRLYYRYIRNFNKNQDTVANLTATSSIFKEFCDTAQVKMDNNGIAFYLIMPIQRLPRYELLLRELVSHTPEDHVDHKNLTEAFDEVKRVNHYINERQKEDEKRLKMVQTLAEQNKKFKSKSGLNQPVRKGSMKPDQKLVGYLKLTIHGAKFHVPVDCSAKLKYGDFTQESEVQKKTDSPSWNKDVVLEIYDKGQDRFFIKFQDKDKGDLGVVTLSVNDLREESLKLVEEGKKPEVRKSIDVSEPDKMKEKMQIALFYKDRHPVLDLSASFTKIS